MGCNNKIYAGYDKDDYGMKDLAKQGNASIEGLIGKDVVVKRRRCY